MVILSFLHLSGTVPAYSGPRRNFAQLRELIVLFPTFSRRVAFEKFVGASIVRDLPRLRIELEVFTQTLGDTSQHKDLGEGTSHSEGRIAVRIGPCRGSQEIVHVIG